jgi:hypothetical protein
VFSHKQYSTPPLAATDILPCRLSPSPSVLSLRSPAMFCLLIVTQILEEMKKSQNTEVSAESFDT